MRLLSNEAVLAVGMKFESLAHAGMAAKELCELVGSPICVKTKTDTLFLFECPSEGCKFTARLSKKAKMPQAECTELVPHDGKCAKVWAATRTCQAEPADESALAEAEGESAPAEAEGESSSEESEEGSAPKKGARKPTTAYLARDLIALSVSQLYTLRDVADTAGASTKALQQRINEYTRTEQSPSFANKVKKLGVKHELGLEETNINSLTAMVAALNAAGHCAKILTIPASAVKARLVRVAAQAHSLAMADLLPGERTPFDESKITNEHELSDAHPETEVVLGWTFFLKHMIKLHKDKYHGAGMTLITMDGAHLNDKSAESCGGKTVARLGKLCPLLRASSLY